MREDTAPGAAPDEMLVASDERMVRRGQQKRIDLITNVPINQCGNYQVFSSENLRLRQILVGLEGFSIVSRKNGLISNLQLFDLSYKKSLIVFCYFF